jgi:hypothetical protein
MSHRGQFEDPIVQRSGGVSQRLPNVLLFQFGVLPTKFLSVRIEGH